MLRRCHGSCIVLCSARAAERHREYLRDVPELPIAPNRMSFLMFSVKNCSKEGLFNSSCDGDATWIAGMGHGTPYGIIGTYFTTRPETAVYQLKRDADDPYLLGGAVNNAHRVRGGELPDVLSGLVYRLMDPLSLLPDDADPIPKKAQALPRYGTVRRDI
jgi:hypothetical protein